MVTKVGNKRYLKVGNKRWIKYERLVVLVGCSSKQLASLNTGLLVFARALDVLGRQLGKGWHWLGSLTSDQLDSNGKGYFGRCDAHHELPVKRV
jgi:hypothetical protein